VRGRLCAPRAGDLAEVADPVEALANAIVAVLGGVPDHAYASQDEIEDLLQRAKVKYTKANVAPALGWLEGDGRLERDAIPARRGIARGGRLVTGPTVLAGLQPILEVSPEHVGTGVEDKA
jgi:hypothetical protein